MKKYHAVKNVADVIKATHQPQETVYASSEDEIRQRAFEIHVAGGRIHGRDLDDWLQAERELKRVGKHRDKP